MLQVHTTPLATQFTRPTRPKCTKCFLQTFLVRGLQNRPTSASSSHHRASRRASRQAPAALPTASLRLCGFHSTHKATTDLSGSSRRCCAPTRRGGLQSAGQIRRSGGGHRWGRFWAALPSSTWRPPSLAQHRRKATTAASSGKERRNHTSFGLLKANAGQKTTGATIHRRRLVSKETVDGWCECQDAVVDQSTASLRAIVPAVLLSSETIFEMPAWQCKPLPSSLAWEDRTMGDAQPLPSSHACEDRTMGDARTAPAHEAAPTQARAYIFVHHGSKFKCNVSKADGGQTQTVFSFFFTTTHPPIRIPRTPLNHKRPYDNSIICHLITQVQLTYKTCHRRPFTQKLARCGPLIHRPSAYTKNIVVWHKEREKERKKEKSGP